MFAKFKVPQKIFGKIHMSIDVDDKKFLFCSGHCLKPQIFLWEAIVFVCIKLTDRIFWFEMFFTDKILIKQTFSVQTMTYISLKRKNIKRLKERNKNQTFCCFLIKFGLNRKFSFKHTMKWLKEKKGYENLGSKVGILPLTL